MNKSTERCEPAHHRRGAATTDESLPADTTRIARFGPVGHRRRLRRLPAVGGVRPARRRRADQRHRLGGHQAQGRPAPAGRDRPRSAGARRPDGRSRPGRDPPGRRRRPRQLRVVAAALHGIARGGRPPAGRAVGPAGDHLSPRPAGGRRQDRPADPAAHHRAEPAAAVAARVAGREPRRDRRVDPGTAGADRRLSRRARQPQQPGGPCSSARSRASATWWRRGMPR